MTKTPNLELSMKKLLYLFCLLTTSAIASDHLQINGFGTIGAMKAFTDETEYVSDFYTQSFKNSSGSTNKIVYESETKLGLQVDYLVNDRLSLTTQLLLKNNYKDRWVIEPELAFAKIRLTSNTDLRLGRLKPSVYMLSDYSNMNHSNMWVRPPRDMYSLVPVSNMNGFDFIYKRNFDSFKLLVQPFFGQTKVIMPNPDHHLDVKDIRGLNINTEIDNLTLRFGYSRANIKIIRPKELGKIKSDISNPANINIGNTTLGGMLGLTNLPSANNMLSELAPVNNISEFTSIGFMYEKNNWSFIGEYGIRKTDFFDPDNHSYYLSIGKRINKFTPYISYSAIDVKSKAYYNIKNYQSGYGPIVDTVVKDVLNAYGTELIKTTFTSQDTRTIGLRYDLNDHTALKIQLDNIKTKSGNGLSIYRGLFDRSTNSFISKSHTVNVLTMTMDFIF